MKTTIFLLTTLLIATTSMAQVEPANSSEYDTISPAALEKHNLLEKLGEVNKKLENVPKGLKLLMEKGKILEQLDKGEEAVIIYKKAIEHHPNSFRPYYSLAAFYHNKGAALSNSDLKLVEQLKEKKDAYFDKAIPLLERAHEINPENETVIRTLLQLYAYNNEDRKYKKMKAKLIRK